MSNSRRSAHSAIEEFHRLMDMPPLKALEPARRARLIASHVLDTLERQTGLQAPLEDILDVIEHHAGGKVRCGRLLGAKAQYLLFRDRSLLVLLPIKGCRRFYIMPIALSLDLGLERQNQIGGLLKIRADQGKAGAESLCMLWKTEAHTADITLPARIEDLDPSLKGILEDFETIVSAMRRSFLALPPVTRPTQTMVDESVIERVEHDGLWKGPEGLFYWPSYLSSPFEVTADMERARALLQDLGSLALWAFPMLPDTLEVSIYSQVGTTEPPEILCHFPSRDDTAGHCGLAKLLMQPILTREWQTLVLAHDLELPVGHVTQMAKSAAKAIGLPVDRVVIKRPDCRRALWLEQEYGAVFARVETYRDPRPIMEEQDRLHIGPHPLRFQMAETCGTSFALQESVQEVFADTHLGPLRVAMGGGERAEILRAMTFDLNEEIPAQGYQTYPIGSHDHFRYSLLVGRAHDAQLRRPFGYTTLSGSLVETPPRHPDDRIYGLTAATYALHINIEHIAVDERVVSPAPRVALIAAVSHAVVDLLSRLWEQATAQNVHFELDIAVDHPGDTTIPGDAELLAWALAQIRARIAASDSFARHVSIANISQEWAGGTII